jgi:hypothetical protein
VNKTKQDKLKEALRRERVGATVVSYQRRPEKHESHVPRGGPLPQESVRAHGTRGPGGSEL